MSTKSNLVENLTDTELAAELARLTPYSELEEDGRNLMLAAARRAAWRAELDAATEEFRLREIARRGAASAAYLATVRVVQAGSSRLGAVVRGPVLAVPEESSVHWGWLGPVHPGEGELAVLVSPGCPAIPSTWLVGPADRVVEGVRTRLARETDPRSRRRLEALIEECARERADRRLTTR